MLDGRHDEERKEHHHYLLRRNYFPHQGAPSSRDASGQAPRCVGKWKGLLSTPPASPFPEIRTEDSFTHPNTYNAKLTAGFTMRKEGLYSDIP